MKATKRCAVCGKFREYDEDDRYCIPCGHESLESQCECGRSFDYALSEKDQVHCPRCGRSWKGRDRGYD